MLLIEQGQTVFKSVVIDKCLVLRQNKKKVTTVTDSISIRLIENTSNFS